MNLLGRPFLEQELQNDTNGLLGGRLIDADIGNQPSDQLIHTPPIGVMVNNCMGRKGGAERLPIRHVYEYGRAWHSCITQKYR